MHVSIRELLDQGFKDLVAHPLRTVLTLAGFGMSMAIATVLISAGLGLESTLSAALRSLGEGQMVADPGRTTGVGGISRSGRRVQLRYDDVLEVMPDLKAFEQVAPFFDLRGGGASSRRYSIPWSPVRAVGKDYFRVRGTPLVEGRWFLEEESSEGRWVAILNQGLRQMIFRDQPAVGEWIEWRGRRMAVVGVVRDEAVFPYLVFIPYATVRQMADARYVSGVVARPAADASWDQATSELRRVLAGVGGFDPADENALEIEDNREFTQKVATVTRALQALILTIAAVSLGLGGLGVANMMVISVTERTREIGLRKALGATPRAIHTQILVEALLLVVSGGALGLVGGASSCAAIRNLPLTARYAASLEWSTPTAVLCLLALAVVGILAGSMPARRAAALTPVEALRWQ